MAGLARSMSQYLYGGRAPEAPLGDSTAPSVNGSEPTPTGASSEGEGAASSPLGLGEICALHAICDHPAQKAKFLQEALGFRFLRLLEDEFPKVYRFTTSVFPSDDDDVITSPYNSLLACDWSREFAVTSSGPSPFLSVLR